MANGTSIATLVASGLDPLRLLWIYIVQYIPLIAVAILVLLVGWLLGRVLGGIVRRFVHFTGIDDEIERSELNQRLKLDVNSRYALLSRMVGSIVEWVIVIGAVGLACNVLNLTQVNVFIGSILAYIPNVIAAIVILTAGILASRFISDLIITGIDVSHAPLGDEKLAAALARYAIIVFSVMAALTQLQIVPRLIEIAFAGVVFALSLAFGLGGKDHAREWLAQMRRSGGAK